MVINFHIEDDIAYIQGEEVGHLKGLSEGILIGQKAAKIDAVFKLLKKGLEIELITDLLPFTIAEVRQINKLWILEQKMQVLQAARSKMAADLAIDLNVKIEVIEKLLNRKN